MSESLDTAGVVLTLRESAAGGLALPERVTVSEWADRERILDSQTSAEAGPWRTGRTPYLREIMDSFTDIETERITYVKCTQVGGTETILNMLGYVIDQDPGPTLYVLPTEDVVKRFSQVRLAPMLNASPALLRRLGPRSHDVQRFQYQFDRMPLLMAWPSPSALASFPIRNLFLDEVDKYPPWVGKEASPVDLARERTKTFWNHRIVEVSTPTVEEGYIWQSWLRSDRCSYHVPCPHCGEYQILVRPQVRVPEGVRDTQRIRAERIAWYECLHCRGRIEDTHQAAILEKGVWCPECCRVDKAGQVLGERPSRRHRGFHLNALYSPWLTFSDLMGEWFDSQTDHAKLQNVINSWLAEPWRDTAVEVNTEGLRKLECEHVEGTFPAGTVVLLATVDVQKDHLHYAVRAWSAGDESWLIERGTLWEYDPDTGEVVGEWSNLERLVLKREWPSADGKSKMRVRWMGLDGHYRTEEVYAFQRSRAETCKVLWAEESLVGKPWDNVVIDPQKKRKLLKKAPERLKQMIWKLDTNYYKDRLARLINQGEVWRLYRETPENHVLELGSEHKVAKRNVRTGAVNYVWMQRAGMENHGWDLEVYQLALADMCEEARRPRATSQATTKTRIGQSGWMQLGGGWMK